MAVQETRTLPAPFIDKLGTDLATQITAQAQIPVTPVVTTGTFCNPKACSDNFLPISSTNGAGRFITVSVAII